jgi:hypothetical protein
MKQGAWTGGSTRHFSPRKPHRKGSKKRSSVVSPVQDPGPVPHDPSHIRLNWRRGCNVASAGDVAFVCESIQSQTKAPGS